EALERGVIEQVVAHIRDPAIDGRVRTPTGRSAHNVRTTLAVRRVWKWTVAPEVPILGAPSTGSGPRDTIADARAHRPRRRGSGTQAGNGAGQRKGPRRRGRRRQPPPRATRPRGSGLRGRRG